LFSVLIQSSIGFCFLMPRVCWLLFSSSVVALSFCFVSCLVLLLKCLGSAPPLGSRPSPADPYPSCLPTPHRFGWSAAHPVGLGLPTLHCPIGRVPHQDWPLVFQRPNGPARWDLPSTGPSPQALEPWPPIASGPSPSVRGGPPIGWGGLRKGGRTQGRGFDFEEL